MITFLKNRRIFLLFFSGIGSVIILLIVYFINGGNFERQKNISVNQASVFALQRKYTDSTTLKFERVIEFNNSIYKVWSFSDALYVQNWTQCNVIKVDTLGNIITTFGRKGHAPGEFASINGVSIDERAISIIDNHNLTISEFKNNGTLLQSKKIGFGITEGIKISNQLCLFKTYNSSTEDSESYEIFDLISNVKLPKTIPRLQVSNAPKDAYNIELSGFYIVRSQKLIFRVYSFTGQFSAFDSTGKLLYQAYTVDKSPLPKVTIRGSGKDMMVIPASRDINLDADVDDKYLYILSNAATPDIKMIAAGTNAQGVIDIYRVSDGTYLCSMKIPMITNSKDKLLQKSSPLTISICKNRLYVVQGVGIYCFSIDTAKIVTASH